MRSNVLLAPFSCASPRSGPAASFYQQTDYKGQEIGKLTGDVYYARMDDYVSVFMVTPEGIVLVEPIGIEFATWLKGELNTPLQRAGQVRHLQPFALGSRLRRRGLRRYGALHRPRKHAEEHRHASGQHAAAGERARAGYQRQRPASNRRKRKAT